MLASTGGVPPAPTASSFQLTSELHFMVPQELADEAEGYLEATGRRCGVGHRSLAVGSLRSSRRTACEVYPTRGTPRHASNFVAGPAQATLPRPLRVRRAEREQGQQGSTGAHNNMGLALEAALASEQSRARSGLSV